MILPTGLKFPPLPKGEADIRSWAEGLQSTIMTMFNILSRSVSGLAMKGAIADRPDPTNSGRFFYATDTKVLYYDDGAWETV